MKKEGLGVLFLVFCIIICINLVSAACGSTQTTHINDVYPYAWKITPSCPTGTYAQGINCYCWNPIEEPTANFGTTPGHRCRYETHDNYSPFGGQPASITERQLFFGCGMGDSTVNSWFTYQCCDTCTSGTCTSLGAECGSLGDGCGETLSCGTCGSAEPICLTNQCVECVADSDCPSGEECNNNICEQIPSSGKLALLNIEACSQAGADYVKTGKLWAAGGTTSSLILVDYDGDKGYGPHSPVNLCAKQDYAQFRIYDNLCGAKEESCPAGYTSQGRVQQGTTCDGQAVAEDIDGTALDGGWIQLCSKNYNGVPAAIFVEHVDDCTHESRGCPTGYVLAGQFHVASGSVCQGSSNYAYDWRGRAMEDGWMRLCVKDIVTTPVPPATCEEDQIIMKLSSQNNAHGEMWYEINYPVNICFDKIFGERYQAGVDEDPHNCTGTNKILGLSSETNAHAERTEGTVYNAFACYGDLVCQSISNECSSLGADWKRVVSLSSSLNAHLANDSSYGLKICCSRTAPPTPTPGTRYWSNTNGEEIGRHLQKGANVSDTILMVWQDTGLAPGTKVAFEIYEKDGGLLNPNDEIRTGSSNITASVNANGDAIGIWIVMPADLNQGGNEDEDSEYYFVVGGTNGTFLAISGEENSEPEAVILAPNDRAKFLMGSSIFFAQDSEDEDDLLKILWNFDDNNVTEFNGVCRSRGVNANTTHVYSSAGTKNIVLRAEEIGRSPKQYDEDYRTIYAYKNGLNMFAEITEPERGHIEFGSRTVHFLGNDSFVANCSATCLSPDTSLMPCYQVSGLIGTAQVTLHCFDYLKTHATWGIGHYWNLWFNWTFYNVANPEIIIDEEYGNWVSNYNTVVDFNKAFGTDGEHRAKLKIGFEKIC